MLSANSGHEQRRPDGDNGPIVATGKAPLHTYAACVALVTIVQTTR
jgi:hypothetical protein